MASILKSRKYNEDKKTNLGTLCTLRRFVLSVSGWLTSKQKWRPPVTKIWLAAWNYNRTWKGWKSGCLTCLHWRKRVTNRYISVFPNLFIFWSSQLWWPGRLDWHELSRLFNQWLIRWKSKNQPGNKTSLWEIHFLFSYFLETSQIFAASHSIHVAT